MKSATASKLSAWACLCAAMVIVGSSMVFGKIITHTFPVFLASGLRFAIASALMLPLLKFREKRVFTLARKDVLSLAFMAFCGQFIFTVLVLLGLRYTSAIEAGIITSTSPAMMVGLSFCFFGERPGAVRWMAVGLVVAGIVSVNLGGGPGEGLSGGGYTTGGRLAGNLMMVGAVAGEAVFLLMRKRISPRISNLALTAWLSFTGMVMFLPFALFQAWDFDFSAVSPGAWWAIVYFGAVFTVVAYLFWFSGVSKVSGTTAGIFTAVMPVSAVILSCIFLKETFTLYHGAGILLVLSAILIMALVPGGRPRRSVETGA